MDRAARLLRGMKLPGECLEPETLARAAWPAAVGAKIAKRTRAVGYVDGCLTIEVLDPVWLPQLRTMYGHILTHVQEIAGADAVKSIRLREGAPRIEPQRAEAPRAAAKDEADGIPDPMLRRLYRRSRKRALA